jgi:hypothetical protein
MSRPQKPDCFVVLLPATYFFMACSRRLPHVIELYKVKQSLTEAFSDSGEI